MVEAQWPHEVVGGVACAASHQGDSQIAIVEHVSDSGFMFFSFPDGHVWHSDHAALTWELKKRPATNAKRPSAALAPADRAPTRSKKSSPAKLAYSHAYHNTREEFLAQCRADGVDPDMVVCAERAKAAGRDASALASARKK